jgi:hypothetical protein
MPAASTQEGERRKRPTLRYVRIAFSAVCGVVCLLLIVLWVRSYSTSDFIVGVGANGPASQFVFESQYGHLGIGRRPDDLLPSRSMSWSYKTYSHTTSLRPPLPWRTVYTGDTFVTPVWSVLLLLSAIATAPWIRWRFSLRTLLIAMRLIAALLGLIAISIR